MFVNLNPLEAFWIAINAIGLLVAVMVFTTAMADRKALIDSGEDGSRKVVSRISVRYALVCVIGQSLFLYLGLFGALTPEPQPHVIDQAQALYGLNFVVVLIVVSVMSTVERILMLIDRAALRSLFLARRALDSLPTLPPTPATSTPVPVSPPEGGQP